MVFVALGSRGDAQPLAVLASAVAERGLRVSFATHAELKGHLQHSREASPLSAHVSWRPLATPCFVRPTSADEAHTPDILDLQGRRRAEWVEAVAAARDADALVCNLFAMPPVYHLSERLEVPWMCCSPCLVPYSMPPGFEQGFAETMPELFAFLREQVRARFRKVATADSFCWLNEAISASFFLNDESCVAGMTTGIDSGRFSQTCDGS